MMSKPEGFKSLQDAISSSLVSTTRAAGLVCAEDLAFQRSLDSEVGPIIEKDSGRLLDLAKSLLWSSASGTNVEAPVLEDVDDIENQWRSVVDVIDSLLEKADICLDEYTGLIKNKDTGKPPEAPPVPKQARKISVKDLSRGAETLTKPQLKFRREVANHDTIPFRPLLRTKPHALVPLEKSLDIVKEDGVDQYQHPYKVELDELKYPSSVFEIAEPIPYKPFEGTTATWVNTPEAVQSMLEELKSAKEIAIDLEHHDAHSYIGLVSLMQISTREKDWIIDTLQPWREDLQVLNEVFANPHIVKVFHGAFMDIVWLQRDLGLYVVGLFDTYHAVRALGYPQASLASLLLRFINFNADKQYQMADWRIRPLPEPMFNYARSDTHFLLFIYDNLRNQLNTKSQTETEHPTAMESALYNSKETSSLRFERPIYDVEHGSGQGGWFGMISRTPALFTKEQFAVFRAVHQWRDQVARQNDESVNYVMPKHVIFQIAREMPMDQAALLGVSHPISPLMRMRSSELLQVIQGAKASGANGPDMKDVLARARKRKPSEEPLAPESVKAVKMGAPPPPASSGDQTSQILEPLVLLPREATSRLWGSAFGSSLWDPSSSSLSGEDGIRLSVPLPQLTAEVFADADADVTKPPMPIVEDPGARAEHAYVKERSSKSSKNDIFVAKEAGGGRKRKKQDADEQMHNNSRGQDELAQDKIGIESTVPHPDHTVTQPREKRRAKAELQQEEQQKAKQARRAEKKAKKRAEKKQQQMNGGQPENGTSTTGTTSAQASADEGAEPFDYAKAPSILHAKPGDPWSGQARKQPFDPYAKATQAPSGAPRRGKPIQGRSQTFNR